MKTSHEGPLTLRISVTDRCQLRCRYCMPAEGIRLSRHEDILSYEEISEFVRRLQDWRGLQTVRITGGDPLVRLDIEVLVKMLSKLGIPDLAMTTNGQHLKALAPQLKDAGLHRVNISLDSLRPDIYRDLSRGGHLSQTLAGIEAAFECGLQPVKLNMVVMRGINDSDVESVLSFALERGCELRFLEVMPIGVAASQFEDHFVSASAIRARIADSFALTPLPLHPSLTSRRFSVTGPNGHRGIVGFISPCSDAFCPGCQRLRLTSNGHLIGCLAGTNSIHVRPFLRETSPESVVALRSACEEALGHKRSKPHFTREHSIATIGG